MEKPKQVLPSVSSNAFIAPRHLCRLLGISRRTLRRWIKTKILPAPMRLGSGGQTLRWHPNEIISFLQMATEVGLVKPKTALLHPEDGEQEECEHS